MRWCRLFLGSAVLNDLGSHVDATVKDQTAVDERVAMLHSRIATIIQYTYLYFRSLGWQSIVYLKWVLMNGGSRHFHRTTSALRLCSVRLGDCPNGEMKIAYLCCLRENTVRDGDVSWAVQLSAEKADKWIYRADICTSFLPRHSTAAELNEPTPPPHFTISPFEHNQQSPLCQLTMTFSVAEKTLAAACHD